MSGLPLPPPEQPAIDPQTGKWTQPWYNLMVQVVQPSTLGTVVVASSQSDQEAGTSTTSYVTPAMQQFHPSAAKFWAYVTVVGTTYTLAASYNISTFARAGTGRLNVNFTVPFASTAWAPGGTFVRDTVSTGASANQRSISVRQGSVAATSVEFEVIAANGNSADPDAFSIWGWGDQ